MVKISFLGAGSVVFARNVLGDSLNAPSLRDADIALLDIDPERLHIAQVMLQNINRTIGANANISAYLAADARTALAGSDFQRRLRSATYSAFVLFSEQVQAVPAVASFVPANQHHLYGQAQCLRQQALHRGYSGR